MGPSGVSSTNQNLVSPKHIFIFFPALLCKATLNFKEALRASRGSQRRANTATSTSPGAGSGAWTAPERLQRTQPSTARARWAWHTWGTLGLAHPEHAGLGTPGWFWHSWLVFTPTPRAAPAPRPGHGRPGWAGLPQHSPAEEFCSQEAGRDFYREKKGICPWEKCWFSVLNRQIWISPHMA